MATLRNTSIILLRLAGWTSIAAAYDITTATTPAPSTCSPPHESTLPRPCLPRGSDEISRQIKGAAPPARYEFACTEFRHESRTTWRNC